MITLQALENRTLDSKREMDIMNALDEMKSLKSRQERVDSDALLAALQRSADDDRASLVAEDEAAVRSQAPALIAILSLLCLSVAVSRTRLQHAPASPALLGADDHALSPPWMPAASQPEPGKPERTLLTHFGQKLDSRAPHAGAGHAAAAVDVRQAAG